jgi:TniQ protein
MTLPVTLQHHDGEAPIDLLARLASVNAFPSLRNFLEHTETTAMAIVGGDTEALELVSEWSGVTVGRLQSCVIAGSGDRNGWRIGKATFNKDMRPGRMQRFCAACVVDDRERMTGRILARAYRRPWWMCRGIEGCPEHKCKLTEVTVSEVAVVYDFPRFVETNLAMISERASDTRCSLQPELDKYLVDRVLGDSCTRFVDQLEAHVVAEFSRYLGSFLAKHKVVDCMEEESNQREWGFKLLSKGKGEICRVIAVVIDDKRPMVRYVEPFLGPMVRWFRRNSDKPAYQPVIELVKGIVERHMPFGEGHVFINPVSERHIYCVNSAHADYGLTKSRIRDLMAAHDPMFRVGFDDASTYFDAAALRPILQAARKTLTSKEAAVVLGVGNMRLLEFVEAGLIPAVEKRTAENRAYTRISEHDLNEFLRSLTTKMAVVADDAGLLTLTGAARVWVRPFHNLLTMILDGSLIGVLTDGTEPVLERVRLAPDAFQSETGRLAGGTDELMRLKEVEKALGTTTATVNELIDRGYLNIQTMRRQDTNREVKFVVRSSLGEFDAIHISLSAVAKCHGTHRAAMKGQLEAFGIHPVFHPEGFVARFYLRSEVAQAGFNIV